VTAGLPLVQRSYLGALLPESLLHMLESYGPGVFAAALSGDHNTPEIIWTAGMRQQRLIPAMLQVRGCLTLCLTCMLLMLTCTKHDAKWRQLAGGLCHWVCTLLCYTVRSQVLQLMFYLPALGYSSRCAPPQRACVLMHLIASLTFALPAI
jgi:hypothetical protein